MGEVEHFAATACGQRRPLPAGGKAGASGDPGARTLRRRHACQPGPDDRVPDDSGADDPEEG